METRYEKRHVGLFSITIQPIDRMSLSVRAAQRVLRRLMAGGGARGLMLKRANMKRERIDSICQKASGAPLDFEP